MECLKLHKYYKNRHKHNFCQDCGARLRWQGFFIKLFYLSFILLIMPLAFAEVQSFPNTITIKTYNDNTTCLTNITTEQDSHTYDCMDNITSTFTFTLQRNLTTTDDILKNTQGTLDDINDTLERFDDNFNSIIMTCDQITKQYGDINSYFKLYTQCNSDIAVCNKDKADYVVKVNELTPFKANYETCSESLTETSNKLNQYSNVIIPSMQGNLSSVSKNLNQSEKSKLLWFLFGAGLTGIILIIKEKKRNPTLQRHKTLGLIGGRIR